MKRRPKGTGTIERTRDGKYRARFPFKPGAREDIDGSPFDSYAEAEAALDGLLAELQDADAVRGGVTLKKLGEKALAHREREGYRAVDSDQDVFDLRIEPWQNARMPASATTKGDVRAWLAAMRNKKTGRPLAAQTRRNALNLLRGIFACGIENELVDENPCEGIKVKDHGSTKSGSTFLTLAEVSALVAASFEDEPGVALKIGTGMRSGELRSLRWEDVHEDHITVRYGSPESPTKNGHTRDVPILPLAREALNALRLRREAAEGAAQDKVLPAVSGGYRARGQVFDRIQWKAWLKAAGLSRRVRPHDLRHTCATLLLQGAWGRAWSYEEVKEMLGHSSVKVTERYAKATGTLAQKAAAAMHKPEISPQPEGPEVAQAAEILQRRGSDSNRRMTVLQTQHPPRFFRGEVDVAGLCRAYVEAVAQGDPRAIVKGLALADAVWDAGLMVSRASSV
jgi:integrase